MLAVCSRRYAHCMRAPIRYRLTDDEESFIRAGVVGSLPPGTVMTDDEVDAAVLEFSKRLTVAHYRTLREGVAEFRQMIASNAALSSRFPAGMTIGDVLPELPGGLAGIAGYTAVDEAEAVTRDAV
jgi:hypothetical protein